MNEHLGPLASLVGTWAGDKGEDRAPSDDLGVENNKYREQIVFEVLNEVRNHEQILQGLRYKTTAWEIGKGDKPFHEELGYWLWDAKNEQVIRCFMVPRGVNVMAGATVKADAKEFILKATCGDITYGILSNKFLDQKFKTISYTLKVQIISANEFTYEEDTELQIKGVKEVFHHIDKNHLRKV